jgi:hypothetical protein
MRTVAVFIVTVVNVTVNTVKVYVTLRRDRAELSIEAGW